MELNPFNRSKKKYQQHIAEVSSMVSVEIIDHLSANSDSELRISVGKAPRRVMPGEFLGTIDMCVNQALFNRAAAFAGRLAYDSVASQKVSTHRVNVGHHDWQHAVNEDGLTMVYKPVGQMSASRAT